MTARDFAFQIDKEFAEKIDDLGEFVARVGLEAMARVVQKSPVDTGRFKGNWFASIGNISTETRQATDSSGGVTISNAATILDTYSDIEGFPVIYVQNNLPYAQKLEDGSSTQAPSGMVGLTIVELEAMFSGESI